MQEVMADEEVVDDGAKGTGRRDEADADEEGWEDRRVWE